MWYFGDTVTRGTLEKGTDGFFGVSHLPRELTG